MNTRNNYEFLNCHLYVDELLVGFPNLVDLIDIIYRQFRNNELRSTIKFYSTNSRVWKSLLIDSQW